MKEINVKIIDPVGLHARPASELVQVASKFSCNITINYNNRDASAKSIITVMALGIKKDAQIKIVADGADEAQAIEAIQNKLLDRKIIG